MPLYGNLWLLKDYRSSDSTNFDMVYVCAAMRDNMRENTAEKCTGKEISLFRAESANVVSSSDYHA